MTKHYHYSENILSSQNHVSKPNVVWVADMTSFELDKGKKVHVFFCIDIFTNRVIGSIFRTKTITATEIVKELNKAIDKRLPIKPRRELIIHTDRGSQFTGKTYRNFIKEKEGFILPSMSRKASPKDNAVAERFMCTFKEHQVNGKTFEQAIQESLLSGSKSYRSVTNLFIKSLNKRPNRKTLLKSPERYNNDVLMAYLLMRKPKLSS